MNAPKLNRRQFLKLTGAACALAIPTLFGYDLVRDAQGELPSNGSPYAQVDVLGKWPSQPGEACPILLLINERSENPFGLYLAEILRAEGLNCFHIAPVSALDSAPLEWFDLILLAEGPLDNAQAEQLKNYVDRGGRLVAMKPDVHLASLFGLEPVTGKTTEGYWQVEPKNSIGQGIAAERLQFHGTADHYRLAGAQAVAWLAEDGDTLTDFPAVTLYRYGQGQAALWAFDLARSVVYTRQGNPAWADRELDGLEGIRVCDMFKGWVDLDRIAIPQADKQQCLLTNLLVALSQTARPLPRLWYFPGTAETMLIATGDAHGNPASAVEDVLTRVEQRGGHMSVYYSAFPSSDMRRAARRAKRWMEDLPLVGDVVANPFAKPPAPPQVMDWRMRGHEIGLHPFVEEGLETGWRRYWKEFTGLGYGPVPPTVRTHRILWTGWIETARMQATYGMRMNLDYYHVGPAFQTEAGEWVYGHFTGSGLPMRFVDQQGRILKIYQQLTQLTDEHLLAKLPWEGGWPKLSAEAAAEVSRTLLRRSLRGDYSAIATNFHVDPFAVGGEYASEAAHWLEGTLDYAAANGIPIWSALEWLHFTEIRHDAGLEDVWWQPAVQRLSFRLVAQAAPEVDLTVMVPLRHRDAKLTQLKVDGLVVEHRERKVSEVSYGWLSVPAGPHQVVATYA